MELAETAPAMIVTVVTTPRFMKKRRNFSSARFTRIFAASSLAPASAPTSFRLMVIPRISQCHRIDFADVPFHQRGKGCLGIAVRIFPQQRDVIPFLHSLINAADRGKVTILFNTL